MANGLLGVHGHLVLSRVIMAANHDQGRVPTLHQPKVVIIVLEQTMKRNCATPSYVLVNLKVWICFYLVNAHTLRTSDEW